MAKDIAHISAHVFAPQASMLTDAQFTLGSAPLGPLRPPMWGHGSPGRRRGSPPTRGTGHSRHTAVKPFMMAVGSWVEVFHAPLP